MLACICFPVLSIMSFECLKEEDANARPSHAAYRFFFSCGILDVLMASFSLIGNSGFLWLLATLLLLLDKGRAGKGLMLFFAIALAYVIGNVIVKDLVMRPRPFQQYGVMELLVPPPPVLPFRRATLRLPLPR